MAALVVFATLVTVLCAAASVRRLLLALRVTELDPDVLAGVLAREGREGLVARLETWLAGAGQAADDDAFERAVVELVREASGDEARTSAVLAEALLALEQRARAWGRVPRVCANVATTAGFLLASLVLRRGLAAGELSDLGGDLRQLFFTGLVAQAVAVVALGVVGATFCAQVHRVSHRLAQTRVRSAHDLVLRVTAGAAAGATGATGTPAEEAPAERPDSTRGVL